MYSSSSNVVRVGMARQLRSGNACGNEVENTSIVEGSGVGKRRATLGSDRGLAHDDIYVLPLS